MCCWPSHGICMHPPRGPSAQHEHCYVQQEPVHLYRITLPAQRWDSSEPALTVIREGGCYGVDGHYCWEQAADSSMHGPCQVFVVA